VTAEVCPHHFALTDRALRGFDSRYKMNPPLRTPRDIDALIAGLADGTIDAIASDHTPQAAEKKLRELDQAPFGVIGLETLLPICIQALIEPGRLTWPRLIEKLTLRPARILGIPRGTLKPGESADVTIIDPAQTWTIDADRFLSKSRNTPFQGRAVRGRAVAVIVGGEVKHRLG
jgi:dihydroorotase